MQDQHHAQVPMVLLEISNGLVSFVSGKITFPISQIDNSINSLAMFLKLQYEKMNIKSKLFDMVSNLF